MGKHSKFSARASLAAVGVRMRQLGIWQVIERQVRIEQKVIKHTPSNKLLDAFINILAGGQGLVEVNTRVRPDEGVQRAFGRAVCAEQSTVSETLNQCTEETVEQLRQALQAATPIAPLTYHDLRHDFAHRMRQQGWTLEEVALYLGHTDQRGWPVIAATLRYTQAGYADVLARLKGQQQERDAADE